MKLFSLYRVELRRLLLSKATWLIMAFCLFAPLLRLVSEIYGGGMSNVYIAAPVLAGTPAGAMAWAALVVLETSRQQRGNTEALTHAVASPRALSAARMLAMATLSAAATVLCAFVHLSYTAAKMEYLFAAPFYFANFLIFMMPTWWISIFFAEGFYQITRRIELTAILYACLAYFSFSEYAKTDYFMRWLNPFVLTYSDGFTSWWPLRIGLYTRLLWLCVAIGLWLSGMLCVRKYGKNLPLSFLRGVRKLYLPMLAVSFFALGARLWVGQPFIDHGPAELTGEDSFIDTPVTKANAIRHFITAKPLTGQISGRSEYDVQKPYTGENRLMMNPGYQMKRMAYGGKELPFQTVVDDFNGVRSTYFTLPDDPGKTLVLEYGGFPTIRRSHADFNVSLSVDWDYISLGATSLYPILNVECEEGESFHITIPDTLTPYLNHVPMTEYEDHGNGTRTWNSQVDYVIDFLAGHYRTDTFPAAGTKIQLVYGEAYQEPIEKYDAKQSVVDVFEYCTRHYGALGLVEDEAMTLLQASSMMMGGHAWGGYLEWFETVLSPQTLSDPERGANATEVFIHEMIHQWWGGYGLNCDMEDELWSEEGLAVYSTYRLVKEKYGALYAKQYYVDEWKKAVRGQDREFYNRHPEYLDRLPEKYRTELKWENSGINMYQRMPLMILKAEGLVGGEEKMDAILRDMYANRESYREKMFTYQDFLDCCGLTKEDLTLDEDILL